ncbi:MAG: phosphoribosylanthranilate isomerase, partial [Lentisphaeria bacterium]|nr:phosphoribosylanthranilate isomerase [Lentisphaeria bacterium]
VSCHLTEMTEKKVLLAGGLHPGNVEEAIRKVNPYGVDANSRLKDPEGNLDKLLAREFVAKAKGLMPSN